VPEFLIMIKFFLTVLLLFTFVDKGFSQDVIVTRNMDEIESVIIEVTPTVVKYKKYDDQQGPVLSINKNDVLMIRYQNDLKRPDYKQHAQSIENKNERELKFSHGFWGIKIWQGKNRLSSADIRHLYAGYPEAQRLFNSGKSLNTFGNVIALPSAFVFGFELGTRLAGGSINPTLFVSSCIGLVGGLALGAIGNGQIKKSVKLYNTKIESAHVIKLRLGITNNGIGLCLRF